MTASVLGELLLRHRLVAGLGQRELARRAGLSERALRDLERGATARPRQHTVRTIAEALGLGDADRTALVAAARPAPADVAVMGLVPAADDLVGRAGALWALLDLVLGGRHRIVTVTGPGGVGKSRLAAELSRALRERSPLPVVALDLSALSDTALVAEVIAEGLAGGGPSRLPPLERVAVHVGDRQTVLVLDCFERLVAAAPVIGGLVRRCPGVRVLITSQRPLRLAGERVFRLAPLPPEPSVELFAQRAAAAAPGFRRTGDNAAMLAAICRHLDGLPLAIELAAAWMRLLSPAELVDRLDGRLDLLTGGPLDRPPRHRSLRATLESSLELVGAPAATVFAWLAAFAGGVRLADLEAVAAALGRELGWLLGALTELVDTAIVRVADERDGSRYTLPDTMRQLAAERLAVVGGDAVRSAMARHYLGQVARWRAEPGGTAASLVDRDAGNLRAALLQAAGPEGVPVDAPTAEALHHYYRCTGRLAEGEQALAGVAGRCPRAWTYAARLARLRGDFTAAEDLGRRALDNLDPADDGLRAAARLQLGGLAVERRDRVVARSHLHAVLAYANGRHDADLIGRALTTLGALAAEFGRLGDAERLWSGALAARRRLGGLAATGPVEAGQILYNLAAMALESGRYELAAARADEAESLLRGHLNRMAAAPAALRALALVRLDEPEDAVRAARSALDLLGAQGDDRRHTALIALQCSIALHAAGNLGEARARLAEALPVISVEALRYREETATWLEAHAGLLATRSPAGAARLLGGAGRLRRDSSRPVSPADAAARARAERACRAALGPARYRREVARGARQTAADLAGTL